MELARIRRDDAWFAAEYLRSRFAGFEFEAISGAVVIRLGVTIPDAKLYEGLRDLAGAAFTRILNDAGTLDPRSRAIKYAAGSFEYLGFREGKVSWPSGLWYERRVKIIDGERTDDPLLEVTLASSKMEPFSARARASEFWAASPKGALPWKVFQCIPRYRAQIKARGWWLSVPDTKVWNC